MIWDCNLGELRPILQFGTTMTDPVILVLAVCLVVSNISRLSQLFVRVRSMLTFPIGPRFKLVPNFDEHGTLIAFIPIPPASDMDFISESTSSSFEHLYHPGHGWQTSSFMPVYRYTTVGTIQSACPDI
ncbi:hypothetical protein B0H12DRAFT_786487 [Mycena haematopus]|nr:hypothetical protein B0H12DRAFT_786487 [Mycena haematopus]